MKRLALLPALLLLSVAALAQTPCNPEVDLTCTVDGALEFYRDEPLMEPNVATAAEMVGKEVVNANRATTSPDAFAARVHNSYQDFLNLLSFAVNDVKESEDGEAFVVRFNPLRRGNHLLGLTLTITKPTISEALKDKIPEADRAATVTLLEKQLGDTDDQTWSASYSFASTNCPLNVTRNPACWGRKPSTYGDILSLVLPGVSEGANAVIASQGRLRTIAGNPVDTGAVVVNGRVDLIAAIKAQVAAEKGTIAEGKTLFDAFHLGLLPSLIDNQPQLTASGTYHQPGRLGGPNVRAATVEFQSGRQNINTLRSACQKRAVDDDARSTCLREQLTELAASGLSTDKYVATFTYKKTSEFKLTDLGLETPVAGFTGIDLPSASEYNVKIQGGRELGTVVKGKPPRADLSFEGIRTEDDGVRTKNRWVGTLTVSIPLGENMTVPVSLSYANKAEFLGDQNERFGAHFGLSYRLPGLLGGSLP